MPAYSSTVMKYSFIFLLPLVFLSQRCDAFAPPVRTQTSLMQGVTCTSTSPSSLKIKKGSSEEQPNHATDRRDVLRKALALTSSSLVLLQSQSKPAFAERSLNSVTESYRRYVPRMETGFSYLANDVKEIIENGDKTAYDQLITELSAEKGTKISAMKGTMKIFATAFSDSVVTMFTRELQLATLKTGDEIDKIVAAIQASDKVAALEAHNRALYFAQVYADSANSALPRSLDPIKGPLGVGKRNADRDTSVNGAF